MLDLFVLGSICQGVTVWRVYYVQGGICPGGKCPGNKCPEGYICPGVGVRGHVSGGGGGVMS